MLIGALVLALEVIKTHAQINQGWIDTTEQEVVHTINEPSIHSDLKTQIHKQDIEQSHLAAVMTQAYPIRDG